MSRRSRTCPTTGGGKSSPSSASPSSAPTSARAPARGAERRSMSASSRPRRRGSAPAARCRAGWSAPSGHWPTRSSDRRAISPAKSHAPYMPRCTRSQRSSSNSRNICLPTARDSRRRAPVEDVRALREAPCGLDAATARPTKFRSNWRAIRWTEWPSGISRLRGRTSCRRRRGRRADRGRARVGLERAVRFELGELRDPASVALLAGERRRR